MFNPLKLTLLLVLSFLSVAPALAEATTQIAYVFDGDTVNIQQGSITYKLRIRDIDAPECNQSYGKKARRALMQFCKGAAIEVMITGHDKYQRQLGDLYCNGYSVSTFMIENGHAWFYRQYANNPVLATLETNAQQQKLGLWKQKRPTPPWKWRKRNRH